MEEFLWQFETHREHHEVSNLLIILTVASKLSSHMGNEGDFIIEPLGNWVLGYPECIWVPVDATRATICVEVKCPWELSRWNGKSPNNPPYDCSMDFIDLVASQREPQVKNAIQRSYGYMLVSDVFSSSRTCSFCVANHPFPFSSFIGQQPPIRHSFDVLQHLDSAACT